MYGSEKVKIILTHEMTRPTALTFNIIQKSMDMKYEIKSVVCVQHHAYTIRPNLGRIGECDICSIPT